jgi:hypothetical protein
LALPVGAPIPASLVTGWLSTSTWMALEVAVERLADANRIQADEVRGQIHQTRDVRIGDTRGEIKAPEVAVRVHGVGLAVAETAPESQAGRPTFVLACTRLHPGPFAVALPGVETSVNLALIRWSPA